MAETKPRELDFSPPAGLTRPLWRSLLGNIRDWISPEKLPPLQLTSRPVDVGMLQADRLAMPWYRTVFTNIGDVVSPESLPPLILESRPVDVGELIADQMSHPWWTSLLRNLADRVAPERQPPLEVTSTPVNPSLHSDSEYLLLPLWSSVIDGPKIFLPEPKLGTSAIARVAPLPVAKPDPEEVEFVHVLERAGICNARLCACVFGYRSRPSKWRSCWRAFSGRDETSLRPRRSARLPVVLTQPICPPQFPLPSSGRARGVPREGLSGEGYDGKTAGRPELVQDGQV
jgi:hypothetical protein